ncbi:hypothetical protein [Ornithinibacillus bavariensis]|uniref:Uncharacterized protein n=1 Tax=Ornithinibacillus bavariensis TaxID=545502 RepID=A0A920C6D6_9BACI|nr:hypothetical protein [Ornithinibacillus bavariensis]GIO26488.1 hypothetical protein J43TS3_10990 [Ornithinibacillus bavariensis]
MSSIGIPGLVLTLIPLLVPIALIVFLLIWIYQIKVSNDVQVKQNQKIIDLLEKLNRK